LIFNRSFSLIADFPRLKTGLAAKIACVALPDQSWK